MPAGLLKRFRDGDRDAFHQLVDKYAQSVFNTTYRMLRNKADAQDMTQETFTHIARNAGKFRGGSERGYICGVAVRFSLHMVRSRKRRRERERKFAVEKRYNSHADEPLNAEMKDALENALSELPHDQRAAVVLHHIEGLSCAEVAQALSIREGTAKSRTSRALERMRESLTKGGFPAFAALPAALGQLPRLQPSAALIETCKAAASLAVAAAAVKIVVGGALMKKAQLGITVIIVLALTGICSYVLLSAERTPQVAEKPADIPGEPGLAAGTGMKEKDTPTAAASSEEKEGREIPNAGDGKGKRKEEQAGPAPASVRPETVDAGKSSDEGEWEELVLPDGRRVRVKKGGSAASGSTPPLQPTGRRSRWAPERRQKGDCILSGTVVDSAGNAVARARVCAFAPDAPKREGMVSFGHVRIVATCGEDGAFTGDIPHGKWLLVANYGHILNGRWGLKAAGALEVKLAENEQKSGVTLRFPFALGDMVSVSGQVLDADGKPLAGVSVSIDYRRAFTNKQGKYKLDAILPGEKTIKARGGYGYRDVSMVINLRAGDSLTKTDIVLELKEKGEFSASGTVRNAKGEPVEGAIMYLNTKSRSIRKCYTDANGFYEFKNVKSSKVNIQVTASHKGYECKVMQDVALPAQNIDFILQRMVRVTVNITEAHTLEPIKKFNLRCFRVDDSGSRRHFASQARNTEDGETSLGTTPGRIILEVEAPGYDKGEFDLTVPDAESWETTLQLTPSLEESKKQ
jgi:RNA polymerase sigma-70 factor (ECF subfamily)